MYGIERRNTELDQPERKKHVILILFHSFPAFIIGIYGGVVYAADDIVR